LTYILIGVGVLCCLIIVVALAAVIMLRRGDDDDEPRTNDDGMYTTRTDSVSNIESNSTVATPESSVKEDCQY